MSVKTWDVLSRETGRLLLAGAFPDFPADDVLTALNPRAVAYCRETGEVVYR